MVEVMPAQKQVPKLSSSIIGTPLSHKVVLELTPYQISFLVYKIPIQITNSFEKSKAQKVQVSEQLKELISKYGQ